MIGVGIIRYLPGSGSVPEKDQCAFDGWYYGPGHEWAQALYDDWCRRYPGWIVALVKIDKGRFP